MAPVCSVTGEARVHRCERVCSPVITQSRHLCQHKSQVSCNHTQAPRALKQRQHAVLGSCLQNDSQRNCASLARQGLGFVASAATALALSAEPATALGKVGEWSASGFIFKVSHRKEVAKRASPSAHLNTCSCPGRIRWRLLR